MNDAIAALRSLNYTEREAAFLSLVAAHSGYFLRRQFTRFIQRERGALAQNFLQKAKRQGHIRELPCGPRRTVFHLFARRVYAACGDVESSSRHEKSSREIFRRLLALDYVLDRYQGQSFFSLPSARDKYLRKISVDDAAIDAANAFGELLPTSIFFLDDSPAPTVSLAYIDDGQRTSDKFARFLATHDALILQLRKVEIAYVTVNRRQLSEAKSILQKRFSLSNARTRLCPEGVEGFLEWLYRWQWARHFKQKTSPEELRLLSHGDAIYTRPEHRQILDSYLHQTATLSSIRNYLISNAPQISFEAVILENNYPPILMPEMVYAAFTPESPKPTQMSFLFR